MPESILEEKKKKEKSVVKKVKKAEKQLEKDVKSEEKKTASEKVLEEKQILKEAEEREKERKIEEEAEKQTKKRIADITEKQKKEQDQVIKKVQGRVQPRHGKNYRKMAEQIEKDKEYPAGEAIDLALSTNPSKFDATVEAHFKISVKEKNIRGMVTLTGGVVKEKNILAVTEKNIDQVVEDIKAGKFNFDIMIAELRLMPKLAILAKTLGPKGLMPSPKAGTAVEDVDKAVDDLKGGKVEYRADKQNIVHMAIGKISFGAERVHQNLTALLGVLPYKKIDSIYLTTTMGPSIKVAKK